SGPRSATIHSHPTRTVAEQVLAESIDCSNATLLSAAFTRQQPAVPPLALLPASRRPISVPVLLSGQP
ncbi:MAG: hypothetical protein ACKN9U_25225, partial [Pirellulaceae bacterium]